MNQKVEISVHPKDDYTGFPAFSQVLSAEPLEIVPFPRLKQADTFAVAGFLEALPSVGRRGISFMPTELLRLTEPGERRLAEEAFRSLPAGGPFHEPGYLQVLARRYGHEPVVWLYNAPGGSVYFPSLLMGSVLTEVVFGWPGVGRLMFDAIYSRDYPILLGIFLIISFFVIQVCTQSNVSRAC